jgi:hypothetical protein
MDNATLTSPHRPSKRSSQSLQQFAPQTLAAAVDVIVIQLRRDHFVDIKPVPYPVNGLASVR